MNSKFDFDHLHLAKFWAVRRSKDPNTKVGAVLVRPNGSIASLAYNGFPRGMGDLYSHYEDQEEKLRRIIHAELNAIIVSEDRSLKGYTLYVWPLLPCHRCAVHIIQSGIKRVVSIEQDKDSTWKETINRGRDYLNLAGVAVHTCTWEEFNNEK